MNLLRAVAIYVALSAGAALAQGELDDTARARHAQAIDLARSSQFQESLVILEQLLEQYPESNVLVYDYVATLGWAGRDAEAVNVTLTTNIGELPQYTLLAAAKSARNLGQFRRAEEWYRLAIDNDPEQVDPHIGLALTLGDQNRFEDAIGVIANLPADQSELPQSAQALATLQRQANRPLEALRTYDTLLQDDPTNAIALRGKILVLRDLLLPTQALNLARQHPGILSEHELERLRVDELAIKLRLAANTIYPLELEGQTLNDTIGSIDEFLAEVDDPQASLTLRFDRIVALVARRRTHEAVEEFEALGIPLQEVPAYVLGAAGNAYLALQRADDSLPLLTQASAEAPGNIGYKFSLVYAYLAVDRYPEAMTVAQQVIDAEPMALTVADSPIVKGNEARLRAEVVAAIADATIDRLHNAQQRLESLLDEAPGNADLRHELASVYRSRGWLDRSLYEYSQVLAVDDDLVYAEVGHTYAQLDAQNFRAAESAIQKLRSERPDEPIIERLSRDWDIHNSSELNLEVSSGRSSGTTFGSSQLRLDAKWFTRPVRYNYRAFAHVEDLEADFPEGSAARQRIGAGVEYRQSRWRASAELLVDRTQDRDVGFTGTAEWRMSDYWDLAGQVDLDTSDFQLRAYRHGITADKVGLAATYAANESASITAGTQLLDVSDGNSSSMLYVNGRRRVLIRPRSTFDVTAEVSTSSYSRQNVPYFAPADDFSYLIGGRHDFRIRRRYTRGISQVVELQIGQYDQKGFPREAIWRAAYTLNLDLNSRLYMQFGAQRSRMYYDGTKEHATTLFAALQARL